jgi:poly-gamma-glutamate synthesis protein (capsule biosynthesis protein)
MSKMSEAGLVRLLFEDVYYPDRRAVAMIGARLKQVKLHPIETHHEGARDADQGIPRIAPPGVGGRILRTLQELSRPFGTEILIKGEIGVIAVQ